MHQEQALSEVKIPVCQPYFWKNEIEYVNQALQEGWISSKGRFIDKFEEEFAAHFNYKYALTVSNGTNALHLAIDALGLGSGDEVIIPDFTMVAPVFALVQAGCIPVPVDIDDTWNMDVHLIETRITPKTKAIMVVHNYGHPANMNAIKSICDKNGLLLIEDCAEAIGAKAEGTYVGSWGDVACFSFYANKVITTGEGGMLVTARPEIFETARSRKNMSFGQGNDRFNHPSIGYNYRMTNLQAAIGLAQMEFIDEAIERKIAVARVYLRELADVTGLVLPPEKEWALNVFWVFGIVVEETFGCSKDRLQELLDEKGIETRSFFKPIHQQGFLNSYSFNDDFPTSDALGKNGLYLPSYMDLSDGTIVEICNIIKHIQSEFRGYGEESLYH